MSADPLPTVQIDGVVWTQYIVGNTVYVGGNFATARPAGAAAGVNTTARANLLAYNLTTGALITSWVANTNGEVFTITASPDKSVHLRRRRLHHRERGRLATGSPPSTRPRARSQTFKPSADASVRAIVATTSTVYFGGVFTTVSGMQRGSRLAAVQRQRRCAAQLGAGRRVPAIVGQRDGDVPGW